METRVPARLTAREGRKFGVTVGLAFVLIGAILVWRGATVGAAITVGGGALLVLGGLAAPAHLGPVYRAWMGLAAILSRITSPIVLGVLYFVFITPVGLMRRTFGDNLMRRSLVGGTYWVTRPAGRRQSRLSRQF